MKNAFDKDLKQRLDDASIQDAGFSFDKDKLWGKIEQKKTRKRIQFLPWVSHTAAVAAGLAIGVFFFVHKDRPAENNQEIAVQQKSIPVLKTATDTVYIVKTEMQQSPKTIPETKIKTPQQVPVIAEQKTLTPAITPLQPTKEEQPLLVKNDRTQPKVLHLSDMENENAQPHMIERKKTPFFLVLSNRNPSEPSSETFSMLVAQKLNLTKN